MMILRTAQQEVQNECTWVVNAVRERELLISQLVNFPSYAHFRRIGGFTQLRKSAIDTFNHSDCLRSVLD